ncbi:MAG TPA: hypothetical protein PLW37_14035 [bacterium]|nr:hypothetical protein [bacterium]
MTRKDLEQVYYLNNELKMWQRRLADLQADIALSPKVLDGMPYSKTNAVSSPTEIKAIRIAELSNIIEGKISEIQVTLMDIEVFIVTIEDSLIRQIVEYRCCKLMKWQQIADRIGEGYTEEAVRQSYHRFVKTLDD